MSLHPEASEPAPQLAIPECGLDGALPIHVQLKRVRTLANIVRDVVRLVILSVSMTMILSGVGEEVELRTIKPRDAFGNLHVVLKGVIDKVKNLTRVAVPARWVRGHEYGVEAVIIEKQTQSRVAH